MKKALTLIELIFTIVIIAVVFTVIPKIIYVSNKTLEFAKKEDAIFNIMAKIMDISIKEYDENNTEYDDILAVNDPPVYVLDCNISDGYRIGGFKGSRNCLNGVFESEITADGDEPPYDDVDDYNGSSETLSAYNNSRYKLYINVGYGDEWKKSDYSYGSDGNLSFGFTSTSNSTKTNLKRIYVYVENLEGETISTVKYYSANIGHIKINSVRW